MKLNYFKVSGILLALSFNVTYYYASYLHNNIRTNIYKSRIIKLLKKNHLLSISEIHQKISGADYSTVYRNIEQLVSDEGVKKVVFDKDKVMYEINNEQHDHYHFVCTDCDSVDELDRSVMYLKFLKKHAVTDVIVRGICNNCN